MPEPSTLGRLKRSADRVLGGALAFLMGLAVVNVLWQVFTRFVLESPSSFTEELARFLLIWIGVLGSGYAVGQRAHLALELLPMRLQGAQRRALGLVINASVIVFAVVAMVIGGARLVYVQLMLGQVSPALGWPLGAVYAVLPLSGFVMVFYAVLRVLHPASDEASAAPDGKATEADNAPAHAVEREAFTAAESATRNPNT